MNKVSVLSLLLLVTFTPSVQADRGMVSFIPGVKLFEPTQRALIAWNGKEEILVLSTDLRSSEKTKVLEVIPLPAEPKVTKGDIEVFRKATALINKKIIQEAKAIGTKEASRSIAGEITFHEKIGANDISVVHLLDRDKFIEWVNDYLKKAGVDNPVIPESLKATVKEYIKEGFTWFVFDVVSLDGKPKTNEAIQYQFKTRSLFYPMKISRTNQGETSVELLIMTQRLLSRFPGIPIEKVELRHTPINITADELQSLNKDMDILFKHRENTKLRIWRIKGDFSSFDKDLVAR